MPDRRSVDDVPTQEIERILAIRRRQERARRLHQIAMPEGKYLSVATAAPDGGRNRSTLWDLLPDIDEPAAPVARSNRGVAWGWIFNKVLLLIELLALGSLVLIGLTDLFALRDLNVAVNLARPTLAPTVQPLIDVVLPDGHRPPSESGEAQPNPDEIPEHLRPLMQAITPQPLPTKGPGQPTRIVIPSIKVDSPVVEGDDWEQLKKGVGHHLRTANPGERGNMVLAGHDDVHGEVFRYLQEVQLGDEILVYSDSQVFRYVAIGKRIIEPTEVSVMYPTSEPTLTLITCYPYLIDNQRIIIIGELRS